MQRLDRNYILIGLCWVLVGMVFGAWLGASHHNNFANSHAHINLLGFVTSTLFGMLYWAFPAMGKSRAAMWQFLIYEIGVALLVLGKIIVDNDATETPLLQVGSVLVIIATAMMLWLFATKAEAKAA
jgi:peptidoglycan/LPS O-acetylase OafA/YrhL